ncbi:Htur_1727 family rSAM-partnered candidate RiPP [Halomarina halobia]|uniref:Htur_1727 family rSAM-partnered candidate RiPP n=1 Tax=Halomarina halobia TaxID=3033386 RepID=A0ABD6AEX0_9EURY|nr:Htur_1727 family rSAM-partnered candidate RiPP [Halomarina sp. PSR21]
MVERPERYRIGEYPRDAIDAEWEVLVRGREGNPLRHVGSVSAPTAQAAYERATKLFAWYATDVWLCPAREVRRYSTHALDERAEPAGPNAGDEARTHEL